MLWPNVEKYRDGDQLNAATLNDPIDQLIARTEYLKQALSSFADRANVAVADAALAADALGKKPQLGQPVYRVPGGNAYARAAAVVDEATSQWFWADNQAMAVGIVGSTPSGDSATVVLSGYVSFGTTGINPSDVIADDAPASGRYFLSATPGKLTAAPTGPVIYVCDCEIRKVVVDGVSTPRVMSMLVSPQYRDTGESHIHRSFVISGEPLGGYSVNQGGRILAAYILPDPPPPDSGSDSDSDSGVAPDPNATPSSTSFPTAASTVALHPLGYWASAKDVTYTITATTSGGNPALEWTSNDPDEAGGLESVTFDANKHVSNRVSIGIHGLSVIVRGPDAGTVFSGKYKWTIAMPDKARAWFNVSIDSKYVGFQMNLGMYPELARFVPPLPENGASLSVGGVELRGPMFGDRKQWEILAANDDGGPWLRWYGGETRATGDVSATAPFIWSDTVDLNAKHGRDIVLTVNRMRVGPTGFVTSLQAAPGSPLRVTSAQTGATAMQGALMLGLDVDFKSGGGDAAGAQVVKRIEGSTFVTGPVVERIVAGPGIALVPQQGQGTVTVSASNAVYAGDFETIALKNAKQDLAGGVFPYIKLLGWQTNGTNIDSGFTAKFRVPDHIPYKEYYVVVSASVFGEVADSGVASFTLKGYTLGDIACAVGAQAPDVGTIARPTLSETATIGVDFKSGYTAFDPILVHGFPTKAGDSPGALVLPNDDNGQRQSNAQLWLGKTEGGARVGTKVKPGYFVGLDIARCGTDGSEYIHPIGFLSLRWNLVEA